MIVLRPYQIAACDAVHAAERRGVRRPLVALPTGSGKTVVFSHLLRQRGGRALVLAHRDELIHQAAEKLAAVAPDLPIGVVKAERDEHAAPVVVASVQTVSQPRRLARLVPDFATLVVDEAHHATAASYRTILEHVGSFRPDGPLTLGVTATPERGDGLALDELFEEIVYTKTLLEMIEAGYLSDLRAVQVRLAVDFGRLHTRAGDFQEREVEGLLTAAQAPAKVAEAYATYAPGRRALVFTPTVEMACRMAAALAERGVAAEALDGGTPPDERRALLARFAAGQTAVLCNCAVLTEGFDCPAVDCVVIARPTRSKLLYQQMIGRGTRRRPGKDDCLILDLVGASTRHDLVTAASLFGLAPDAFARQPLTEAVAARRAPKPAPPVPDGELVAHAVDPFAGRRLRWLAGADGSYLLAAGPLRLRLRRRGGEWQALRQERGGWTLLHRSPDLGYAMGAAEDAVRRAGKVVLVDPAAPWRGLPASDKQRALLLARGVAAPPDLTRGAASDLITTGGR